MNLTVGNIRAASGRRKQPFPHLSQEDTAVWEQFVTTAAVAGKRAEYDVRLGGRGLDQVDKEHSHFPMWAALIKKRVDVVLWDGETPWLIEVKPVASFSALGQVLGYGDLWERERRSAHAPKLIVACRACDEDLRPTFGRFGIEVWTMPSAMSDRLAS